MRNQNLIFLFFVVLLEVQACSALDYTEARVLPMSAPCDPSKKCPADFYCHSCLDGSQACLNSPAGQCCGCSGNQCWACEVASMCDMNAPNMCRNAAGGGGELSPGAVVGIIFASLAAAALIVLICVSIASCCRRSHHTVYTDHYAGPAYYPSGGGGTGSFLGGLGTGMLASQMLGSHHYHGYAGGYHGGYGGGGFHAPVATGFHAASGSGFKV